MCREPITTCNRRVYANRPRPSPQPVFDATVNMHTDCRMIGNDLNILLLRLEQLQFDEFPTTASNFTDTVARAARRVYNTHVRMSADYVAARCGELLAVCGESLEPPPTVPPGGVSQRRQMQRLRQALLGQEPAKVRLVAWVDRDISLQHCLRHLTGLTGYFDVAEQDAQLKRVTDNPLETENRRDIAQKLLAFKEAMRLYKERYLDSGEFYREFLGWEQLDMAALVRKLDREWMQFE